MYPHIRPEHTHVERLLTDFAKIDKPTTADFSAFRHKGEIAEKLDAYRLESILMSRKELRKEKHKSSRLAAHMRRAGDQCPSNRCDCHAMISGGRIEALEMRGILAWLKVRIDDPHNGCWLPRDWGDRKFMPNYLRNGVPHKRIHHQQYYQWLASRINRNAVRDVDALVNALRLCRTALQSGRVPPSVMPKTGLKK